MSFFGEKVSISNYDSRLLYCLELFLVFFRVYSVYCIRRKKNSSLPLNNTKPAIMLIKVKTLTGKEIEIDIEPTDKVNLLQGVDHVNAGVLTILRAG